MELLLQLFGIIFKIIMVWALVIISTVFGVTVGVGADFKEARVILLILVGVVSVIVLALTVI